MQMNHRHRKSKYNMDTSEKEEVEESICVVLICYSLSPSGLLLSSLYFF